MASSPFHIVITGPESSGKSTLWNDMKSRVDGHFIEEVAREYLNENGLDYLRVDLRKIAFLQFQKQLEGVHSGKEILISDTCLLTIAIWEEERFGGVDDFTEEWRHLQQIDHYLLCQPDIPWTYDPQREHKADRDRLFDIYQEKIKNTNIPYTILGGSPEERVEQAMSIYNSFIKT